MIFHETAIPGAFLLELERFEDERGSFARSFCAREFEQHGLSPRVVQCNVSTNRRRGTLRGMHCQEGRPEAELIRCTRGALYDVALDLRPGSPAHGKHVGVELRQGEGRLFYVPEGCFHGFLTLEDDTEVSYQMSEFYEPGGAIGVRWDDPAFGIAWPGEVHVTSERDASYPDWTG